jgi:FlaA1/EpsC-like NDP-sugar epimerase
VRFGNVLGSRGSVIKIFEGQIRNGQDVTVTDPDMTRFVMAPPDASKLVLRAGEEANPGEIYVLKMPAVRIGDLVTAAIEYFSGTIGIPSEKIHQRITGSRPGEKKHEELMNQREALRCLDRGDFFVIPPEGAKSEEFRTPVALGAYTSESAKRLDVDEIRNLLVGLDSRVGAHSVARAG